MKDETLQKLIKLVGEGFLREFFGKEKTLKQLKPLYDRAGHYCGSCIFGYNSAPAAAREVFKPSTDAESRFDSIKKNIF